MKFNKSEIYNVIMANYYQTLSTEIKKFKKIKNPNIIKVYILSSEEKFIKDK